MAVITIVVIVLYYIVLFFTICEGDDETSQRLKERASRDAERSKQNLKRTATNQIPMQPLRSDIYANRATKDK